MITWQFFFCFRVAIFKNTFFPEHLQWVLKIWIISLLKKCQPHKFVCVFGGWGGGGGWEGGAGFPSPPVLPFLTPLGGIKNQLFNYFWRMLLKFEGKKIEYSKTWTSYKPLLKTLHNSNFLTGPFLAMYIKFNIW